MTAIHRREMLGTLLSGAAVAALRLAFIPEPAESAALMMSNGSKAPTENLVEKAIFWRGRRVCWWRGGRRVCRWRW